MYIIEPPFVKVTGLPDADDIDKIKVTGKKTDSVLGQTVKSDIEEFEITAAKGWKKDLEGAEWRGQRLCKPEYEFDAEDIEGYTREIKPAGDGSYVIEYKSNKKVDSLALEPRRLVLTKGGRGKLIAKDGENKAVYSGIAWSSTDESIATVDKNGVVTAIKEGNATITATVETDNGPVSGICTITVTPADPGGGGGTLSGQATSGGGDYRDLLTDPLPQQGSNGTNKPNANTVQGTRRSQTGTSQTTGQKSETTTDAAGNGGDGAGSGTTGRVISVSKGDKDKAPGSAEELAVILISCSVLLAAGIFRGKKRGED